MFFLEGHFQASNKNLTFFGKSRNLQILDKRLISFTRHFDPKFSEIIISKCDLVFSLSNFYWELRILKVIFSENIECKRNLFYRRFISDMTHFYRCWGRRIRWSVFSEKVSSCGWEAGGHILGVSGGWVQYVYGVE